jgi:hypothetical protein
VNFTHLSFLPVTLFIAIVFAMIAIIVICVIVILSKSPGVPLTVSEDGGEDSAAHRQTSTEAAGNRRECVSQSFAAVERSVSRRTNAFL